MQAVHESAEATHLELRRIFSAMHAALDVRREELDASVSAAEAFKVTALESELVAVDTALERLQRTRKSVRDVVATRSDNELVAQHAFLSSLLDDSEAQLRALPTAVVEPPHVGLVAEEPALLTVIACFGRVVAPLSITAADLAIEGVPSVVNHGKSLLLHLALGARHLSQSVEELDVSLHLLALSTSVDAVLQGSTSSTELSLPATLSPDSAHRRHQYLFLSTRRHWPTQPHPSDSVM